MEFRIVFVWQRRVCNETVDNLLIEWFESSADDIEYKCTIIETKSNEECQITQRMKEKKNKNMGTWTVKYYKFFNPYTRCISEEKLLFSPFFYLTSNYPNDSVFPLFQMDLCKACHR